MHTNLSILDVEHRADGEARFPVGMPIACSDAERRQKECGQLYDQCQQSSHFAATSLALPSLWLEKSGLHPLQEKCRWLQEGRAVFAQTLSLGLLPAQHPVHLHCPRPGRQGNTVRASKQKAEYHGTALPEHLCAGTPGQRWRDLHLKVVALWSSRGVTGLGLQQPQAICNHLLNKQPSAASESPECLWERNLGLHLETNDVREVCWQTGWDMGTLLTPHGGKEYVRLFGRWGSCL